ncbi:MAG: ATPase domain-containing protein [Thermoplasmata archaeon]
MVSEEKKKVSGKKHSADPGTCAVCGGPLNPKGQCTICGTESKGVPAEQRNPAPADAKANLDSPTANVSASKGPSREEAVKLFSSIKGVGESKAEILYDSGYASLEDLKSAKLEDLSSISGIGGKLAETILKNIAEHSGTAKEKTDSEALSKWLSGDSDDALGVWLGGSVPQQKKSLPTEVGENSDDPAMLALRKWLTGEEDALEQWLGESAEAPVREIAETRELLEKQQILDERETEIKRKEDQVEDMSIELKELKKAIEKELEAVRTGKFDPMRLIEETAELNKNLQTEVRRRKQLEGDISHLKKGTSAVVKYMKKQMVRSGSPALKRRLSEERSVRQRLEIELKKSREIVENLKDQLEEKLKEIPEDKRALKEKELVLVEKEAEIKAREEQLEAYEQAIKGGELAPAGEVSEHELESRLQAELREKEREFLEKEDDLKRRIIKLEEEIQKHRIEEKLRKESQELRKLSAPQIDEVLVRKEKELQAKEKSILLRGEEIERLKDELREKEDELQKLREPLSYKEEELLRREEDLLYREKRLAAERRKVEEAKASALSIDEHEMRQRLESLKAEIARKEDEVRAKEKYLKAKMEELRLREQGLIEEEIDAREEERMLELKVEKVRTGTPRLDDLLLGGVPFGSNILIYGPPFVGKEVVVNAFMAEGLKKGIPIVWVITEKMPSDIREEMGFVISGYEEYEKLGLVKYVDSYSRSMGEVEEDPYTVYLDDPTDYKAILNAVDKVAKEFLKNHKYYRLTFRSVSTLIAYLDPTSIFKFLQAFAGRRKRHRAVALYMIEKGMHTDQEIQMIGSMMEGMFDFKVDQLKSFLSVKGVGDVQSRAWIKYTYSKHGVSIGSFSLDHIK